MDIYLNIIEKNNWLTVKDLTIAPAKSLMRCQSALLVLPPASSTTQRSTISPQAVKLYGMRNNLLFNFAVITKSKKYHRVSS